MFSQREWRILRFCAEECARQKSGELSVYRMLEAYAHAFTIAHDVLLHGLTVDHLADISHLVDLAIYGPRGVPVTFADGTVLPWEPVGRQIDNLLDAQDHLTPEEFYQEFETIHPFVDGNGRVGAILYNLLNGTLHDPRTPPDYRR